MSYFPLHMSLSPTSVAGIVEVMMGVIHARHSGSMVFTSITHELLACPDIVDYTCRLHWCEQASILPVFNAGGPHARGLCQAMHGPQLLRCAIGHETALYPHPGGEQWMGAHVDVAALDLPRVRVQKALVEAWVPSVIARTRGGTGPPLAGGLDDTRGGQGLSHGFRLQAAITVQSHRRVPW